MVYRTRSGVIGAVHVRAGHWSALELPLIDVVDLIHSNTVARKHGIHNYFHQRSKQHQLNTCEMRYYRNAIQTG
jgi:hypothetical protein